MSLKDSTDNNPKLQESIRLAQRWVGNKIQIGSASCRGGGRLVVTTPTKNNSSTVTAIKSFTSSSTPSSIFHVEAVGEGLVSFRLCGRNNLYLTNVMYGDEHRQAVATQLASVPGILADNIGTIVDFAVGRPTDKSNFEGAGFNYSPMTVQKSNGAGPNKLQMFYLEDDGIGIGVRSLFGTYWRYQWWNNTVSQSPHMLGDERWTFRAIRRLERSSYGGSAMSLVDEDSDDEDGEDNDYEDDMEDEEEDEEEDNYDYYGDDSSDDSDDGDDNSDEESGNQMEDASENDSDEED